MTAAWAWLVACVAPGEDALTVGAGADHGVEGRVDRASARWVVGGAPVELALASFGTPSRRVRVGPADHATLTCDDQPCRLWSFREGVTEWWEDRGDRLEQGFVVGAPVGPGPLVLEIGVAGARVASGADGLFLVTGEGPGLRYSGLVATDRVGRVLPARMGPTAEGIRIEVDPTGAAWPIVVDPALVRDDRAPLAGEVDEYAGGSLARLDANGDGWDDLLSASVPGARTGRVALRFGGPAGLSELPDWTYELGGDLQWVEAAEAIGDLDGDGFDDLAIGGAPNVGTPSILVFRGSAAGPGSVPDWSWVGTTTSAIAAADVDGDGRPDLAVGWPGTQRGVGSVGVFRSGPGLLPANPTWTLTGTAQWTYFGDAVAAAGDLDADGDDELLVTTLGPYGGPSTVSLSLGSALGPSAAVTSWAGFAAAGAGDVDGDGFDDVATSAAPTVETRLGGAGFLAVDATFTDADPAFATVLEGIGDWNADGVPDLAVGSPEVNSLWTERTAHLALGGPSGWTAADVELRQADIYETWDNDGDCGSAFAGGDWDGDGIDDVAVGCPYEGPGQVLSTGTILLFPGGPDGDGDGDPDRTDCAPADPAVFHGQIDAWYDGLDANCDGWNDHDQDHDGQSASGSGGPDCDDLDAAHRGCARITGVCPGAVTFEAAGLFPSSPACLVAGTTPGSGEVRRASSCLPSGRVEVEPLATIPERADASGRLSRTLNLAAGQCGGYAQVLQDQYYTTPLVQSP